MIVLADNGNILKAVYAKVKEGILEQGDISWDKKRIETHDARCHNIHCNRIDPAQKHSCLTGIGLQGAFALPSENAINKSKERSGGLLAKMAIAISEGEYSSEINGHSPGCVVAILPFRWYIQPLSQQDHPHATP